MPRCETRVSHGVSRVTCQTYRDSSRRFWPWMMPISLGLVGDVRGEPDYGRKSQGFTRPNSVLRIS